MAPLSAFTTAHWTQGPAVLSRYNGLPSIEINGQGAPGVSSGQALKEMDAIFQKLPKDVGYELTGLSYQEEAAGSQAPALYALSILVIFLCLAALYESWAIPIVGDDGDPAGRDRRGAGGHDCAACSTTSISRSAC